jgi:ActR/RegA family two-component response regulator
MAAPMLRRWLDQRGHTLHVADDVESGFTQAVACRPDTVLVDLTLGATTASTLADRLRTHTVTRTVPLVAIGEPAVVAAGAGKALFERHVMKPIDVDELGAVLLETPAP